MIKNVASPVIRLGEDDTIVNCNCAASASLVYLPDNCLKDITIKKTDSSANAVTITTANGKPLEGAVRQVETATTVGTVTGAGNAAVVVTSALLPNGAITYAIPVEAGATATVAAAIRAYLGTQDIIKQNFTISGSGATVVLTTIDYLPADATLNISTATGTATGITTAASSVNTTAAVPIQLLKQGDYKTLRKTGDSWVVVDSGGANATETLVNKTLTAPTLNGGTLNTVELIDSYQTWHPNPHDYAGAHADWTLSAAELLLPIHAPTNADQAVNAIVSVTKRPFFFINGTGQNLVVKTAAGTGITIANNKTAMVMSDGINVIRLTPDA